MNLPPNYSFLDDDKQILNHAEPITNSPEGLRLYEELAEQFGHLRKEMTTSDFQGMIEGMVITKLL
jgi:hypothetical protein